MKLITIAAALIALSSTVTASAAADAIPRDTSFNVNSAVAKIKKQVPAATAATVHNLPSVRRMPDMVYSRPYEGRELKASVFRPADSKKRPAVIMVHGGGWSSGTPSLQFPLAEQLADRGFVAIPVEYRLTPEEKYPAGLHDVKTAVRWVRANADALGVDPTKIAISGCSAGGQLACLVGMTNGSQRHELGKKAKESEKAREYGDFSSSVDAVVNIDGISTFVSDYNIKDSQERYEKKKVYPANGAWLGGMYNEATENWKEASAILWADENAVPVMFINSELPRYHDGRDALIEKLKGYGIECEVVETGSPVHPFWLCDQWLDVTADNAARFLKKVLYEPQRNAKPIKFQVNFTNPLDQRVVGIPVVLPLKEYGDVKTANVYGSHDIPFQLDDLDGDGVADELVFLLNIDAGYTKHIKVTLNDTIGPQTFEPKSRAYIKLRDERKKHPEVTSVTYPGNSDNNTIYNTVYGHGVVMENLPNAWRIYVDNRQSIDLYGKKNNKALELEETGFYTTPEQYAEGYGRDILWAGKSVAAGSFRGLTDGQPATIDTVTSRTQRILASGSVRSIIEVEDKGWIINGKKVDMTQRYTQYGTNPWFIVEVELDGPGADQVFCSGVQKVGEDGGSGFIGENGLAGSWGTNIPEKKYPELAETLGIGIQAEPANVVAMREDDLNYLVELKPDRHGKIRYYVNFVSAMEKKAPKDLDEWRSRLQDWSKVMLVTYPMEIEKN